MTNERVATLKAARDLVARPNGWTQGAFARDARGVEVDECDDAVCFCLMGALFAAGLAFCCISYLRSATGCFRPSDWNDAPGRTQAEVVAAFDRAIELAEGAPT